MTQRIVAITIAHSARESWNHYRYGEMDSEDLRYDKTRFERLGVRRGSSFHNWDESVRMVCEKGEKS